MLFERYAATTTAKILSHVLSTDIDITKIRLHFIDYSYIQSLNDHWQIKSD